MSGIECVAPRSIRVRLREEPMRSKIVAVVFAVFAFAITSRLDLQFVLAGEQSSVSGYKVLDPIRHGSLTVFPIVASRSYPTAEFLTLDEGLRSAEVVVSEYGNLRGLVRRQVTPNYHHDTAEVNRLVLVNNSKRPLLLLAGEIVTGGKQDRVIGKDRIVPPESDPVDLNVFCVEPGRWVASSDHFGTSGMSYGSAAGSGGGIRSGPGINGVSGRGDGSTLRSRQSNGGQRSESGLGGSEEAAAIDGGRSGGWRAYRAQLRRNSCDQLLRSCDGEQRRKGKSRRSREAD